MAAITPNFTQGTIQTSNSPTDMAIQGDGFFMVQGTDGQPLYTRDGVFQLNSSNTLTTSTGNAVMGWGASNYVVQTQSTPVPMTIPLGSDTVAQATSNVNLSGSLSPTGTTATLRKFCKAAYWATPSTRRRDAAPTPQVYTNPTAEDSSGTATNATGDTSAGSIAAGNYSYELVAVDSTTGTTPGAVETVYAPISASLSGTGEVTLKNLPTPATGTTLALYRADVTNGTPGTYNLVQTFSATDIANNSGTYVDKAPDSSLPISIPSGSDNVSTTLDTNTLSGTYSYYVTYFNASDESRPCELASNSVSVSGGSIELTNLPTLPVPNNNNYTGIRIYRNVSGGVELLPGWPDR